MKILFTILSLFMSSFIFGQVSQSLEGLSLGDQNAFIADHEGAEKKWVEKIVENTIKQYGKVKRNRKAKEWKCSECNVSNVSSSPINIYYKITEGKGQITSYLFFDDGTKFISSENDPKAAANIEKLHLDIYYEVKRYVINENLEDEEDDLKKMEKSLSKLLDKNKDLHEDIEEYKDKILKAEKEIEENLSSQADSKMEIEKHKRQISKTTEKLNKVGRN